MSDTLTQSTTNLLVAAVVQLNLTISKLFSVAIVAFVGVFPAELLEAKILLA